MADDSEPEGGSPDREESDAPTTDETDAPGSSSDSTPDAQTDADGTVFEFVDPTRIDVETAVDSGGTGDGGASDDGVDDGADADDADTHEDDSDTDDTSEDDSDTDDASEDDSDEDDIDYVNREPQISTSADEFDGDASDGTDSERTNARHRSRKTKTPGDPDGADGAEAVADTDGGEPAAVAGTGTGEADVVDDGFLNDAPESDQEMPLTDHIEEMVRRLAVVFAVGGIITLVLYPGADIVNSALNMNLPSATDVINFLWNKHIPGAPEIVDRRPRVYGPLELVLTELKVAALAGLVVGLPVFVYETYLFMRPGLFPTERRYYLAAVPTSLILAIVGVAFAHFLVLPAIFAYFTSYTTGTAIVAFGLKETFNLILILMGYNAIIFQIPLFIMLAIMMNLVTRVWLVERRLLFWASFLGLAFFVSPDPTGMAPIIIAATMITLFEGTLFLLRWTEN